MAVSLDDSVQHNLIVVFLLILFEEGETLSGRNVDRAVCRIELTGQNFKEGRLAGAVRADDAVAVALREFNIYIFEQSFFADSVSYAIGFDHRKLLYFQGL